MIKLYTLLLKEDNSILKPVQIRKWEKEAGWRVSRHRRPSKKVSFTETQIRRRIQDLPEFARPLVKIGVFEYTGDIDE